jgi:outer membrane receptor protein involved in Fe transport
MKTCLRAAGAPARPAARVRSALTAPAGLLSALLAFACLCAEARAARGQETTQGRETTRGQETRAGRTRVAGVVRDSAGAPVGGAEVLLRAEGSPERRALTGDDGRFVFEGVDGRRGTVVVRARGFAPRETGWAADGADAPAELGVTLLPAPVSERVTVTATRTESRLGETAASVRVLTREELRSTAALTLDDALRQVPGFQLFRRTGSRAANPTAQGVSLRGLGASGASRALVLADGVPLNDPFGGWVYWGRVPRESVGRVEVMRGAASDLYGSSALGGVVQILTRRIEERPALSLETSYGNLGTGDASLYASARRGRWGASLAAETFRTEGYFLVADDLRGEADAPAASRHSSLDVTIEREVIDGLRLFARGSYYREARANGTRLQENRTRIRQLTAGGDWSHPALGAFTLRAYASAQVFDQSFSAVSADRDAETLTRLQRVPAQAAGLSAQWSRALGRRHALVAGFDGREARGASDEVGFFGGRPSSAAEAGGRERSFGLFAQDALSLTPKVLLTAGARFDRWRNFDARSATRPLARPGPADLARFADRSETALSPRASLLVRLTDKLSAYAAGYGAFRAPTLNELYRSFRVGDVLTQANEELRAERLVGGEGGVSFGARRFSARGALFWSEVTRAVTNATLSVTPQLITRRRENLGRTRSRGLEVEAEARPAGRWSLSAGYLLTGARVVEFPPDASLEGLRLPQTPRHQLTFAASYAAPAAYAFGVQGRASGAQFDDDRNLFRLRPLFTLDASASRSLGRRAEAFVAAENLLNRRYEVGRTPNTTLGPPALVRAGLRLRFGPR